MNVKDSDENHSRCLPENSGYTYSILDKVIVIRKVAIQQQQQEQIKNTRRRHGKESFYPV